MTRASPIQSSFNGGELSPRMFGRTDEAIYAIGCASLVGWISLLQGPVTAAPGTRFVSPAKGPFRLIPFEFNVTQGYLIEASDLAFRFYTNDVRIEPVAGVPLELVTPWSYDQVLTLDYTQSEDVLYLAHGAVRPQQLDRAGAEAFTIAPIALKSGPYEDENTDETITASVNGTIGAITVTASSPIFQPGDVGGLFKIVARDFSDVPSWQPGIDGVVVGARRRSAGKVYEAVGGTGRTGDQPPVHTDGIAWDGSSVGKDTNSAGPYGEQWQYLYGPLGSGTITAYISPTQVTLQVDKRLADSLVTVTSFRWAFGAFSDRRGWPDAVTIWNERLIFGKGAKVYGSVVGGFNDFSTLDSSGNAQRDLGFAFTLPNPNVIRWLAADRKLLIGTAKAEHVAEQLLIQSETAGPPTIQVETQSTYGSLATKMVLANGRVLAIQRAGRKLLEFGYSVEDDRYVASNLSRFAEHIGKPGFVELAWQQEPEGLVWAVLGDGTLAALTYEPKEQVMGWQRRILGGTMNAKTIATITDPSGSRDQVWVGVQRGNDWWVVLQQKIWDVGDDQAGAFFVDAGLTYSGAPVTGGTGLGHLVGETVSVIADGKVHPDIVVGAGGTWAIQYPASVVTIGYPFPAQLLTLNIEAGAQDGTAQGKIKRISRVTLRLLESMGLRVTVQAGTPQMNEHRVPANPMDQSVPLFTGDTTIDTIGAFERYGQILIERVQPTPATLLAIMPTVTTSPR